MAFRANLSLGVPVCAPISLPANSSKLEYSLAAVMGLAFLTTITFPECAVGTVAKSADSARSGFQCILAEKSVLPAFMDEITELKAIGTTSSP